MNAKKKIAFFTSRVPFPLEKGDKLRAYHQIKHLSKDYDIILCSISDHKITEEAQHELSKYVSKIYVYQTSKLSMLLNLIVAGFGKFPFQVGYFFNSAADFYFKGVIQSEKPDHLFVQLLRMSEYAIRGCEIPKSLDYMDTFSKGIERRMNQSKGIKKFIFRSEYKRLKAYEEKIFDCFDHTFIISEQDKLSFTFEKSKNINILLNGVDEEFFVPNKSVEKVYDIVFTGNMSYPPNVSAVVYIVQDILPLLMKVRPNIQFLIAGATPTTQVKALADENVHVSGWIDDIRDAYNQSKVFLAPLQIGTGLQNKLLEAMSMEIPCITSQLANNALGATHRENILIGNTPEDYATLTLQLLEETDLAERIASKGKEHVENKFNWTAITKQLSNKIFS